MKTQVSLLCLAGCLALFASACNEKDKVAEVSSAIKNRELNHKWQQENCVSSNILGLSRRVQFEFSGNNVKRIHQYYTAANCQDLAATITYTGKYEVKREVHPNIHEIDLNLTTATATPHNATARDWMNNLTFCGKNGWTINQSMDLTANSSDKLCPVTALPENVYDLYSEDADHLYFGEGDEKNDPTNRPKDVDRRDLYKKA